MESIGTLERDPDAKVTIFHKDIVAPVKHSQEQFRKAVEMGASYVRANVDEVTEMDNGNLKVDYTDGKGGKASMEVEILVLSTNLVPNQGNKQLAEALGIDLDEFGFFKEGDPVYKPMATDREGIYLAGTATGPRDICMSISQAAGASANAISLLKDSKGTELTKVERPPEKQVPPEDEPRIGVLVCRCGKNIHGIIDVDALIEYARTLPNVVVAEPDLFGCAGGKYKDIIKEHDLNRMVIGACSPKTHEHLFGLHSQAAGLNKYLFEIVNLRNHCTWVHSKDKDAALEKAKLLIKMGVARARRLEPLHMLSSPVEQKAMVIGGGVSGLVCAKRLGDMGYDVHVVDKSKVLGGKTSWLGSVLGSNTSPRDFMGSLVDDIKGHPKVKVHASTELKSIDGYVGQFNVGLNKDGKTENIEVGAIVVATGAKEMDPEGLYSYGKGGKVVTMGQFERQMAQEGPDMKDDGHVVMISCVGAKRRDPDEQEAYCCSIGCENMLKNARELISSRPGTKVTILHQDWNLPHKFSERIKADIQAMDTVEFIRYSEDNGPTVTPDLLVKVVNDADSKEKEIKADLVVLATPPRAQESNERLKEMIGICLEPNGFFMGALGKLKPLDFTADGIFYCGTASAPMGLPEAIVQGEGAASRVGGIIGRESLELEPTKSFVVDANCDGCAFCIEPCPFNAITLIEYSHKGGTKKTVQVNEALCKGCGVCMATCPKEGIYVRHYRPEMFLDMIKAALEVDQ
jgi:heterodisulfide reductase subunit A